MKHEVERFWQRLNPNYFTKPEINDDQYQIRTKGDCEFDEDFWNIFCEFPFKLVCIRYVTGELGYFELRFRVKHGG